MQTSFASVTTFFITAKRRGRIKFVEGIGPYYSGAQTFGHIKNLWEDGTHFWDNPTDERYTALQYLEKLSVDLEVTKLMQYCGKYNHEVVIESDKLFYLNLMKLRSHIVGIGTIPPEP